MVGQRQHTVKMAPSVGGAAGPQPTPWLLRAMIGEALSPARTPVRCGPPESSVVGQMF